MEFAFLPISKIVLRKKGIIFPWLEKYPIFKILSLRSIGIIPRFMRFVNPKRIRRIEFSLKPPYPQGFLTISEPYRFLLCFLDDRYGFWHLSFVKCQNELPNTDFDSLSHRNSVERKLIILARTLILFAKTQKSLINQGFLTKK